MAQKLSKTCKIIIKLLFSATRDYFSFPLPPVEKCTSAISGWDASFASNSTPWGHKGVTAITLSGKAFAHNNRGISCLSPWKDSDTLATSWFLLILEEFTTKSLKHNVSYSQCVFSQIINLVNTWSQSCHEIMKNEESHWLVIDCDARFVTGWNHKSN